MSALMAVHDVLAQAAALPGAVLASSSDSSDSPGGILTLLLAGPAGGIAFYRMKFRKYRNTDKSDQFERETAVAIRPVEGFDHKYDKIRGTSAKAIKGRNDQKFRERVQRLPADGPQG
jgi:hypothetical protein